MREILFKAKRVDNGEWIEGVPVWDRLKITLRIYEYINVCVDYEDHQIEVTAPYQIVHPSTVCQFTGMKDKNGNKIFEGDKVNQYNHDTNYHSIGFVKWDTLEMGWVIEDEEKNVWVKLYEYHEKTITAHHLR